MLSVHQKSKLFQCHVCKKCFRDSVCVSRHMRQVHKKVSQHKCVLCNYKSPKQSNIIRHCDQCHSEAVVFQDLGFIRCQVCRKLFSSQHSLKKHKEIHEAIAIGFNCPICNCKVAENHMCKFDCNRCNRTFNSKLVLKSHMKIHTKVESVCVAVSVIEDHERLRLQLLNLEFS